VGDDIESLLAELGIDADLMYDDWGASWSWITNYITHSMQLECIDVDKAQYQLQCSAFRQKWFVFNSPIPLDQCDFHKLIPRLRDFDAPPSA
jgi:hypothetical protein